MEDYKIHTVEFTKQIPYNVYMDIKKYLYSTGEKLIPKKNELLYFGYSGYGIRIILISCIPQYSNMQIHKIKYVLTPSRFNDNDYLELTEIRELIGKLSEIGRFLENKSELLPLPLECNRPPRKLIQT